MQRPTPRKVSRRSNPVRKAVVVDSSDIERSSQPYPSGGYDRGSSKRFSSGMVVEKGGADGLFVPCLH